LINLHNIHALDHFKRSTADFRKRLKGTGEPESLTVEGKAELVVQSADAYQELLDRLEELETIAALREGLADADAGRTKPAARVHRELRAKFAAAAAKPASKRRRA
jgi:PHD/YefM family antitoxin component YafN of YafNO toxin-antitoxin module